ncbi:MAG: RNA polymerase sporulation sigma factor SigK [Acutalibacteraceae bacterium]|nr:RNA polymerase sporulation sigma factor SigK [Acutalibacteraceae bacterium]
MFIEVLTAMIKSVFMILNVSNPDEFPRALKPDEESELLEKIANGDENARKKLIEHNLRLVAHVIKKYYSAGYDQDDLISVGTIGMIKAVNSYSADKNTKLATYAARCIDNEILMYFRSQKKVMQNVSMSDPIDVDKEGNELTLIDIISDGSDLTDDIDKRIKCEKLQILINTVLDKREKLIIKWRYGLGARSEMTQREIADKLKISRSYVSRIEKKALQKLYDGYIKGN